MKFEQEILKKHDDNNWIKICTTDNENFILKQCDGDTIHEIVLTTDDVNKIKK